MARRHDGAAPQRASPGRVQRCPLTSLGPWRTICCGSPEFAAIASRTPMSRRARSRRFSGRPFRACKSSIETGLDGAAGSGAGDTGDSTEGAIGLTAGTALLPRCGEVSGVTLRITVGVSEMSLRFPVTRDDAGDELEFVHVTTANSAAAVPLHKNRFTLELLRIVGRRPRAPITQNVDRSQMRQARPATMRNYMQRHAACPSGLPRTTAALVSCWSAMVNTVSRPGTLSGRRKPGARG